MRNHKYIVLFLTFYVFGKFPFLTNNATQVTSKTRNRLDAAFGLLDTSTRTDYRDGPTDVTVLHELAVSKDYQTKARQNSQGHCMSKGL